VCRFAAFESELAVKECEEWMKLYAGGEKETLAAGSSGAVRRCASGIETACGGG
jgi:hypothetical protein